MRTVIKAMMAQLRPPVLLVLPCLHGHAASRAPWPSVLWAATREREREYNAEFVVKAKQAKLQSDGM